MLNVSPIGRNCSQEERDNFEKFDETANVRKTMVEALRKGIRGLRVGRIPSAGRFHSTSFRTGGIKRTRCNSSRRMGSRRFISLVIKRTKVGMITRFSRAPRQSDTR